MPEAGAVHVPVLLREVVAALRPERRDDLPEQDRDVNRAGVGHGASDEMACEFVVVLIRDRGRAQALEMLRSVYELQVVGLAEYERIALERRDLAQERRHEEPALRVHARHLPVRVETLLE